MTQLANKIQRFFSVKFRGVLRKVFKWCTKTRRRKILSITLIILITLIPLRLIFINPKKVKASTVQLTTTDTTIQIDVANRYRAIMETGDTSDYILIYDRAENDSSPDQVMEMNSSSISDGGTSYVLMYDASRKTTILETTSVRVRLKVEGCFDTVGGGACLQDSGSDDNLTVTEEYTFTTEGFFKDVVVDFADGLSLADSDMVASFHGALNDGISGHSGTIYYGDGATESTASTTITISTSPDHYVVYQGLTNYQDIIMGAMVIDGDRHLSNSTNGSLRFYGDVSTDWIRFYETVTQTITGQGDAQFFIQFQPQASLDTEAEREAMFNDLTNPDILDFTTGSEWNDSPASPGVNFDGSNDYVTVADTAVLDITNTGSLEVWLRPDTVSSAESSFGSWSAMANDPNGAGTTDGNDGVDIVIVGSKIYYAAYLHDDATEEFSTSSSDLDGSNQTTWTDQADPGGAGAAEGTSVGIDSDGDKLYYAVLATDGTTESFYTANSDFDGTNFSGWTDQTDPDGCGVSGLCTIDVTIVGSKMYFATYLHDYGAGTNAFRTADSDLDGTNFSGWILQTGTGHTTSTVNASTSVAVDSNGEKLYYVAYTNDTGTLPYAEEFSTASSDLDGSSFSGWTSQSAPDGAREFSNIDMTVVGDKLYYVAGLHVSTTVVFGTSSSDLDGTNFAAWAYHNTGLPVAGGGETSSPAVATDGKSLYYTYSCHNNDVEHLSLASSTVTSHPVISKADAYELIQTGGGFVFDWDGSPKSFGSIRTDEFAHIAITLDGSTMKYYVNGEEKRSQTVTTDFASNASALKIGGDATFFDGIIDEVRIWSDARTAAEIQQNMFEQISGSEAGLVGYWRFNENTGTDADDEASGDNNGTLTDGPTWQTGFVPDQYNEAEGAYTVDASGSQVELDIDGGSNVSTLVNDAALATGDTSFTADSTTGFPDGGGTTTYYAYIEGDKFSYTDVDGTVFSGIPSSGELSVIGHADNSVVSLSKRHDPMIKMRNYRNINPPDEAVLEGDRLQKDYDFIADVKPISDAYFADELTWASTLENAAAVTSPDVGSAGTVGLATFVAGKYGNGMQVDLDGKEPYFPSASNISGTAGMVEFWFKETGAPAATGAFFACDDGAGNVDMELARGGDDNDIDFTIDDTAEGGGAHVNSWNGISVPIYDGEWHHVRLEYDAGTDIPDLYLDGIQQTRDATSAWVPMTPQTNVYIGDVSSSDRNIGGVIDEFRVYSPLSGGIDDLAQGGDTADSDEYLFSEARDYTLDFVVDDASNRGEYLFLGSDSMFSGVNIDLETAGSGTSPDLYWQYWNGTSWASLEAISGFTDNTSDLTSDGSIYWDENPTNWRPYSMNGSTDLYYIRAHLETGDYASQSPIENFIKTDILLFQYTRYDGNISTENQTLEIPGYTSGSPPIVHWALDEGYDTTANDRSSHNNPGTITNATWQTEDLCVSEKCLHFDGDGDYISRPDDAEFDFDENRDFTITGWFRHGPISTSADVLVEKYESTGGDGGYRIQMESDGDISFGVDDANGSYADDTVTSTSADYDDNQWHHFTAIKDSISNLYLYLDGNLIDTDSSIGSTGSLENDDTFYVGIAGDGASNDFDGFIDEVKVYRYPRSADEIKSDFIKGSSTKGSSAHFGNNDAWLSNGLVGYWKMDESSGNASDSSGNGNDLTDTNTVSFVGGKFGNAGDFEKDNSEYQYIADNASLSIAGDLTLAGWIKPESTTASTQFNIAGKWGGGNESYLLAQYGDEIRFYIDSSSNYEETSATNLATGTWYHVMGVYNATSQTAKIYVNGQEQTSTTTGTIPASIGDDAGRFLLGGEAGSETFEVGASGDDAFCRSDATFPTLTYMWIPYLDSYFRSFVRFPINVPPGATINDGCWIRTYLHGDYSGPGVAQLQATDEDDASDFTSNPYSRSMLGATVNWQMSAGSQYDERQSPEIKTIIQDKVDRADFNQNDHIAIRALYISGGAEGRTRVYQWDGDSSYAAELHIEYTNNLYDGLIDEMRIYNRAFTSSEVERLYNWAPGPMGYWKMDEGTGTTTTYDTSGNEYNGTLTSITESSWVPGKFGSALELDGTADFVDVGVGPTDVRTVDFWVYPETTTEYFVNLTSTTDYVWADAGTVTATGFTSPTIYVDGVESSTIIADKWQHIAVVTNTSEDASNLELGRTADANYLEGKIDDVRIYNYARTQEQIIEDMNAGHPAPGSPVGSPVSYWKFDEGYGTTANDSSINDNDLTLSATSWTNSGKFGKAFDGDGTEYLSRADDPDFDFAETDDFSISGWIQHDTIATNPDYIVVKNNGAGYKVYMDADGDIVFAIDDDATWTPDDVVGDSLSKNYDDNAWHHFVAVKDGTTDMYLYVDGVLVDSEGTVDATATLVNADPLYVGVDDDGSSNPFDGQIDELKIYRLAMTADQVKTEYNMGKAQVLGYTGTDSSNNPLYSSSSSYCPPGTSCNSPIAEWRFDENTGTATAYDSAGGNYNGTLTSILESSWTSGKVGSALNLDGTADFIDIGTGPSTVNTVEFWVYPETTTEYFVNLTSDTDYIWANAGTVTATGFTSPTIYVDGMVSSTIVADQWQHIVITTDTAENASNFDIGRTQDANYLEGKIDQVRLFSNALTQSQISWLCNQGKAVGHWKLDECSGTTAYDSSVHENNGTITIGGTGDNTTAGTCSSGNSTEAWNNGTSGKRNASLSFDDTDDYITVTDANALDLTSGLSISAWVKTNADEADNVIVSKGTSYEMGINADGDIYWVGVDSQDDASTKVTSGSWRHVVITNNDTTITYYVDGIQTGTDASGIVADNATDLYIGYDGTNFFDGLIDDVKIFNYVLTQQQIKTDYNAGAVNFGY